MSSFGSLSAEETSQAADLPQLTMPVNQVAPGTAEFRTLESPSGESERTTLQEWLRLRDGEGPLDDPSNHAYFKARGHRRSEGGFSRQVMEDLEADGDREKTIVSTAVYRALIFDLMESVPEEQRIAIKSEGVTIGLQMRALKFCSSADRLGFLRGVSQIYLEGKGDSHFFYSQILPLLYFASPQEKLKLFHTIANRAKGARGKRARALLNLVVGSAVDFQELEYLCEKLTPAKLFKFKLGEHVAWSMLGPRMAYEAHENGNGAGPYEKLSALKAEIERRIKLCRQDPRVRQTECARKFSRIAQGNLKLVEHELSRPRSQSDRLKRFRFIERKMHLEFRYGVRFLDEDNSKQAARWSIPELREAESALARIPHRFLRITPKLDVIRRVRALGPWEAAERDQETGEIKIANCVCEAKSLRPGKSGMSDFAEALSHELGHSIQLGDEKKVRIVSQSVPTTVRLLRECASRECAGKPEVPERQRMILAVLSEAKSLRELRRCLDAFGVERLKEEMGYPILREFIAAGMLPRLMLPASGISRYSSQEAIERRFQKVRDALLAYQLEVGSDSDFQDCAYVRQQQEWAKTLLEFIAHSEAQGLPLNGLRKVDQSIEFLVRLYRRFGVVIKVEQQAAWDSLSSIVWHRNVRALCSSIPTDTVSTFALPTVIHLGSDSSDNSRVEIDSATKAVSVFLPCAEALPSRVAGLQQQLRKLLKERESDISLEGRFHSRIRGAKARVLGPTNPWFDFRGYMRISGWRDESNNPLIKLHGAGRDVHCTVGGELMLFDYPLVLHGRLVMLTFNMVERLLFSYATPPRPEHQPWLYARTDPWEDFACHFSHYLASPDLIRFSPLKFDFQEMIFRLYEEQPAVRRRLVQAILDRRRSVQAGAGEQEKELVEMFHAPPRHGA